MGGNCSCHNIQATSSIVKHLKCNTWRDRTSPQRTPLIFDCDDKRFGHKATFSLTSDWGLSICHWIDSEVLGQFYTSGTNAENRNHQKEVNCSCAEWNIHFLKWQIQKWNHAGFRHKEISALSLSHAASHIYTNQTGKLSSLLWGKLAQQSTPEKVCVQ